MKSTNEYSFFLRTRLIAREPATAPLHNCITSMVASLLYHTNSPVIEGSEREADP
jgi:hypothetical protein